MDTKNIDIPVLDTQRLKLRAFIPEDTEALSIILSDKEIVKYFPRSEPWPYPVVERWINHHWDHWRKHGYGWWAVEHIEDHRLLGWCGLNVLDETGETEVLYLLDKVYWGKGLATEAVRKSIEYGFSFIQLPMIIGLVHPDNLASKRVLEKAGLRYNKRVQMWGLELEYYQVKLRDFEQVENN